MTLKEKTRRFAFGVVEVIQSQRTLQSKLGMVCKLARQQKGLAGSDVAKAAGCTVSHYFNLESGAKKSLESYRPPIDVLRLDSEALLALVVEPQTITMSQAAALLLEDASAANGSENDSWSLASEEIVNAALVRDALTALQTDWSSERKAGEICRLIRLRQGWTQKDIGNRVNHSGVYISALERGEMSLDRYPTVLRALGIDDARCFRIIKEGPTDHNTVESLINEAIRQRHCDTAIVQQS